MHKALFPDLVVNGEKVPHTVVAAETQNHDAPAGKPGIAWRKAANAVAVRTLLLQAANARKIELDPQQVGKGQFETDEEALIRALLDDVVKTEIPSDEKIRAEWKRDPKRFRALPLWEVSHILFACDPRDDSACSKSYDKADTIAKQLIETPDLFNLFAQTESDCGSKTAAGALGQIGPGDTVPEFQNVLQQMKEGAITPSPVLTRHGWHIIRMDAVALGEVLPFEVVRDKIALAMEKATWAASAKAFTKTLLANADIKGADLARL